jgi:ADP-heptose:LPS heptosyltransferase
MGDILLSMGEAKALHKSAKQPILIVGRDGRLVQHQGLFDGVPYLLTRRPPVARGYRRLLNCPGVRSYIASKTPEQWVWKPYTPIPADLKFTPGELEFAERYRGHVMVEPNVKDVGHRNKAWPHWTELMAALRAAGVSTVQCGPGGTANIADHFALTPSFRYAAAVLSVSRAFVGTEGGLMHAAAAVGTPGVIIFGAFISPEVTGYAMHRNLFTGEGLGCGMRTDCPHCRDAMRKITPGAVLDNLKELLCNRTSNESSTSTTT